MELPSTWRRLSLSTVAAALTRPVRAPRVPAEPVPVSPGPPALGGGAPYAGVPDVGAPYAGVPDVGAPYAGVPVILGGTRVRQTDQTTCGSTVLLMLAATGDPVLARWLEHGDLPARLAPHQVPPEIPPELRPPVGTSSVPRTTVTQRLTAAQQHIKLRTSARALGLLAWPARFGTPPWTAAREGRFPGVRYRGEPFDDAAPGAAEVLAQVHQATQSGVPVPLYTGGDLGRGAATALPRHVVLAVPPPAGAEPGGTPAGAEPGGTRAGAEPGGTPAGAEPGGTRALHLYDPAGGKVYRVPLGDLLHRTTPHPALGGWSHVCWVLLPSRTG